MASRINRFRNDHETRGRRPKALEAPKEPARPRTHWDHVLEEMVWLAKDFESERKWKMAQAKRVAMRASKSKLDQASRGEKRMKEEEHRVRRLATNISKDVKKFWMKIEKLVLYKHQLELEERKKKALDKQLDFLLGQTERYSTMLAENLVDLPFSYERSSPHLSRTMPSESVVEQSGHQNEKDTEPAEGHDCSEPYSDSDRSSESPSQICASVEEPDSKDLHKGSHLHNVESEDEFCLGSEDDLEDDEATLEADEALITKEERREELAALQDEIDLPIEELLKRYGVNEGDEEESTESHDEDDSEKCTEQNLQQNRVATTVGENVAGRSVGTRESLCDNQQENMALLPSTGALKDDPKNAVSNEARTSASQRLDVEEVDVNRSVSLLVDLGEYTDHSPVPSAGNSMSTATILDKGGGQDVELLDRKFIRRADSRREGITMKESPMASDSDNENDDEEYILAAFAGEDKDDETTLVEEEELAKSEVNDTINEVELLKQEGELPIEELLARYKKDEYSDEDDADESGDTSTSLESKEVDPITCLDSKLENVQASTSAKLMDDKVANDGILEDANAGPETEHALEETNEKEVQKRMEEERDSENIIADAAAAARLAQPTGNTFSTTKVRTKLPFLLKHSLREYQHIGLDWLVTMYDKRLNGILADEMGLGKTIMTISLLAHLACEKGIWGPHLIVVPTSVMLNWETEFMKWCPAFKVLTYFGSAKERKVKRQGWSKSNSFHVCITTYRLVIQDAKAFKRKKWKYLILDEAHLIKNWKSQRWQTLLNFNSKRRILLTGTPLQNDLMELWSLMHFLMPHVFQSHQEFKDWFSNPISGIVEGQDHVNKEIVDRLHNVLRPFILRRLKQDVEKQLPKKYEHVICCRLSRRQRNLYEDFIASSETQATLASGNFLGMINVLMQLRKVCNHPDLFEGRPIISSFDMVGIEQQLNSSICTILTDDPYSSVDLMGLNLVFSQLEFLVNSWEYDEVSAIATPSCLIEEIGSWSENGLSQGIHKQEPMKLGKNIFEEIQQALHEEKVRQLRERSAAFAWWNSLRCRKKPLYGSDLRKTLTIEHPVYDVHKQKNNPSCYLDFSSRVADLVLMPSERCQKMMNLIESFVFTIPAARTPPPVAWCSKLESPILLNPAFKERCAKELSPLLEPIRPVIVRQQLYFPDRRLIQFDCGKLQELALLLRRLKSEGHRALIFTQMTKMLDVLEAFINLYGYTYMRLDGSTQPEERQTLMQRFNTNPKIFLFILSTRSGGVGINLVGADTVIFYDSDWNPAMDQQAQDRCHRIGQTREVHIYRLISQSTIEENILKKANQKRALDNLVIQSGGYNTEFFKKLDPMELFSGHKGVGADNAEKGVLIASEISGNRPQHLLSNAEVEAALKNAEDEADYMALKKVEQEEAADNQEFLEEAVGKLEDDEYANEEEGKTDEKEVQDERDHTSLVKDANADIIGGEHTYIVDRTLVLADADDDIDMLADVKQMAAAAAAAGHASSSFENHLRPIERYAMRFLDLWDPIIDKTAIESQVRFEEMEWELDRLEKLKEEQEAEIDEDDEPLFYENWDTDFANEAYRQQVEALAQQQLMQEQLEWDSGDEAGLEDEGNEAALELKRKLKKKLKKTKFKSLKKGSLASDGETLYEDEALINNYLDLDHIDHPENGGLPLRSHLQRKRKAPKLFEDETFLKTHAKKFKKELVSNLALDKNNQSKALGDIEYLETADGDDLDTTLVEFARHKNKVGGKVSMLGVAPKKFILIKQEKIKKKGTRKSKDHLPSADPWASSEDAILCAIVHEYGGNWDLASNTLDGMPAGGFYRGRYRHPIHCRERFRELFLQNISSVADNSKNEKIGSSAPSKALLKVTEEHVKLLLDVAHELPDNELLLQKHFAAVLSSVARMKSGFYNSRNQNLTFSNNLSNVVGGFSFIPIKHTFNKSKEDQLMITGNGRDESFNLVAAALADSLKFKAEEPILADQQTAGLILSGEEQRIALSAEQLEATLEFPQVSGEQDELSFPYCTTVVIHGADAQEAPVDAPGNFLREPTCNIAENHFRVASKMLLEGEAFSWASSALACSGSMGSRYGARPQGLGKHRPTTDSAQPPKPKLSRLLDADVGILALNSEIQICEGTNGQVGSSEVTTPVTVVDMPFLLSQLRFHLDTVALEFASVTEIEDPFGSNSMCDASVLSLDFHEMIPHHYDTNFDARSDDPEILSGVF